LPRKKIPPDLRSLARGYTEMCVRTLAGIVSQEAIPPAAPVWAASALLARGWGKEDHSSPSPSIRSTSSGLEEGEREALATFGGPPLYRHTGGVTLNGGPGLRSPGLAPPTSKPRPDP